MDKGKGHAIYKSKTGPQKFKLTKENEKILAFVESKKDVLGKFCAPEDHDTEPQHVSQAKQVIPSMLRLAMEQHVLEMMCPNF